MEASVGLKRLVREMSTRELVEGWEARKGPHSNPDIEMVTQKVFTAIRAAEKIIQKVIARHPPYLEVPEDELYWLINNGFKRRDLERE